MARQVIEWWRITERAPPKGERLLVWGNGPLRFGYLDDLGNWRATHHGPIRGTPSHWTFIPEPLDA